jgi:cysteine desulfurase / selenocysteine lyase
VSASGRGSASPPDWGAIRGDYPTSGGRAYLDTACKGLPGSAAERTLHEHVRALRDPRGRSTTDDTIAMLAQFERARLAASALIHAQRDEIALVPSTEAGISAVAAALRLEAGANGVASDLEFVGTVLPWRWLERRGVHLKLVPHREGRIEVADVAAAIDSHTRVVVASSVQEVNGFRLDLAELAGACHASDVVLVVDAIQHVGPLLLDLTETPVDVVAVGGHKWLCAPFGMGFLYVSRRLLERLDPPMRAFMTAKPPSDDWREYLESPSRHPADALRFPAGAEKLELAALGTTLAAAGLAAAATTLLEIGLEAIAERSARLVQATATALESAGAEIVTPRAGLCSSIVTFRSAADIDSDRALVERLADASILTSLRFTTRVGGIRVSPYFYNDESEIERLVAVVASEIRRRRAKRHGSGRLDLRRG